MDDIFVIFKSAEHLSKFCDYSNMSSSYEQKKYQKLPFFNIEVSREEA